VERFGVVVDILPDNHMPYYKWLKCLPPGILGRVKKSLGPRAIYPLDDMGWIISIPSFVEHKLPFDKILKTVKALEKLLDRLDIGRIHLGKIHNTINRQMADILREKGRQVLTRSFIKEMAMLLYIIRIIDKCGVDFAAQEIGIICRHKTRKRFMLYLLAGYSNYITGYEPKMWENQSLYDELFNQLGLAVGTTQNIESITNKCKIIILDTIPQRQYLEGIDQTKLVINLSGSNYTQGSPLNGLWVNDSFLKMPPDISTGMDESFAGLEHLVWECMLFDDRDFRTVYEAKEIQWEHIKKLVRVINDRGIDVEALHLNDKILAHREVYRALASIYK